MDLHAVVKHCNNCNSLMHTTPACPHPTAPTRQRVCNIMSTPGPDPLATEEPTSNYLQHKATQPLELHFRTLLAPPKDPSEYHTTTAGARQCPTHHAMQQQLEKNASNSKPQSHSQAPSSSPFSTTFLKPSARPPPPPLRRLHARRNRAGRNSHPPGRGSVPLRDDDCASGVSELCY
ncbi:hypothetical protein Q7P37_008384 [Cladosporium fusiforme]